MRKKIVAGNWKMNNTLSEAVFLTDSILGKLNSSDKIIKIIIPPFPYLESLSSKIGETENVYIGAQNCHTESNGAYTGEISAKMLQSVGCQYVLIGHSERRAYFNETNEELVLKIKEALLYKIKPIFLLGSIYFIIF